MSTQQHITAIHMMWTYMHAFTPGMEANYIWKYLSKVQQVLSEYFKYKYKYSSWNHSTSTVLV